MTNESDLERELMGKPVYVEARLNGASENGGTILYYGTFNGIRSLADKSVIVLKDAWHFNKANVYWGVMPDRTSKIRSKNAYVSLTDMLSIDEISKEVEE